MATPADQATAVSGELDVIGCNANVHSKTVAAATAIGDAYGKVNVFDSPEAWEKEARRSFWGEGSFDVARYFDALKQEDSEHGSVLIYAKSLQSTQTVLFKSPGEVPDGVVCTADIQTSGKGREGNTWTSPAGCLMFTVASSMKIARTLPLGQYLACLAIVQGVRSLPGFQDLDINIKWPNDIYVNKTIKIGGILSQSTIKGNQNRVYFGIGLNVDNEHPTTCLNKLVEAKTTREAVLAAILGHYQKLYSTFEANGFEGEIQEAYEQAWLHTGQQVKLSAENDRVAVVQGLCVASGGSLLAKMVDDGTMVELFPDGNSFDFFQGLISKKVLAP